MATLYKLTNEKKKTFNNTTWGEGITHSGTGKGPLCSEGWIHAYRHPLLATFFNPIHGNFKNPLLWESEGEVALDDGTKVGCQTLTTVRQIELPKMSTVQRVACGILAVKEVYREKRWNEWAERWLSGEDRSADSAEKIKQRVALIYSSIYGINTTNSAIAISYAATVAEYAESAAYYTTAAVHPVGRNIDLLSFLQKAILFK